MASSKNDICNEALGHLGVLKEIQDMDNESTQEAMAFRRFYDVIRKQVLEDFAWPFANKTIALALVESNPTDEWLFSYRYPSDCQHVIKIPSGFANDSRQSRVPLKIAQDDAGKLILTNKPSAKLEYTVDVTDVTRFDAGFETAFALRLAANVAPALTGGDPFKLGDKCAQRYVFEITRAEANAANEEQPQDLPDPEMISERNDGWNSKTCR